MNNDRRRKHPHGCDISIQNSGLITFHSRPVRALQLRQGDRVVFNCLHGQLYVYKADGDEGLCVYGRHSQYHVHSAKFARYILSCVQGMPSDVAKTDLICSGAKEWIDVCGVRTEAVVIINRYNRHD